MLMCTISFLCFAGEGRGETPGGTPLCKGVQPTSGMSGGFTRPSPEQMEVFSRRKEAEKQARRAMAERQGKIERRVDVLEGEVVQLRRIDASPTGSAPQSPSIQDVQRLVEEEVARRLRDAGLGGERLDTMITREMTSMRSSVGAELRGIIDQRMGSSLDTRIRTSVDTSNVALKAAIMADVTRVIEGKMTDLERRLDTSMDQRARQVFEAQRGVFSASVMSEVDGLVNRKMEDFTRRVAELIQKESEALERKLKELQITLETTIQQGLEAEVRTREEELRRLNEEIVRRIEDLQTSMERMIQGGLEGEVAGRRETVTQLGASLEEKMRVLKTSIEAILRAGFDKEAAARREAVRQLAEDIGTLSGELQKLGGIVTSLVEAETASDGGI